MCFLNDYILFTIILFVMIRDSQFMSSYCSASIYGSKLSCEFQNAIQESKHLTGNQRTVIGLCLERISNHLNSRGLA